MLLLRKKRRHECTHCGEIDPEASCAGAQQEDVCDSGVSGTVVGAVGGSSIESHDASLPLPTCCTDHREHSNHNRDGKQLPKVSPPFWHNRRRYPIQPTAAAGTIRILTAELYVKQIGRRQLVLVIRSLKSKSTDVEHVS